MTPKLAVPEQDLRERLAFETMLANLSSKFVKALYDRLDAEIGDAQRRICEHLDLDLSSLWLWSAEEPHYLNLTHLYRPLGGPPLPETMDATTYFPWSQEQLVNGRVVAVASMEELPPEAMRDRETWHHYGIKASLGIPLMVGGENPIGLLSFNTMLEERAWPDFIVQRLVMVAEIFANALARKRADAALRESEGRLGLAADAAEAGLWTLDPSRGVFWATERARSIFGYSPDEVISTERFEASVHPDDRNLVLDAIEKSARTGENIRVDYRIIRPVDGSVRWIASHGRPRPMPTGGRGHLTGISTDITERKLAEEHVRDLSRRLIRAHEEERALLARELHDDVTQRLAVLAIDVGLAEFAATEGAQVKAMRTIREGLVRLCEDIHSLAYNLHPSVLDELGLAGALRAECDRRASHGQLDLSIKVDPLPGGLARDAALCLFRIAQEALNNVARHAGSRKASITLSPTGGGLLLTVRDNGVGFDPASPEKSRSLGVASMRERVALVNGTLDIESAPGRGTAVIAWVPADGGPP